MQKTPEQITSFLDRVLLNVEKPGRYVGGEYNSTVKNWDTMDFKVAMAFPDIYDLGMSNLGTLILMDCINAQPDMLCERVYSPWHDMESRMRQDRIPLHTLESKHAIRDFDLLAISLPYEQLYTNALNLLDLAGLPVRSASRNENYPLVIAGGHACYNPEPMADFMDAFAIGEGEEILVEIARTLQKLRGANRQTQLKALAQIQGVYVPAFYEPVYDEQGIYTGTFPIDTDLPKTILKRIVPILPPPFTKYPVPNIDTVHNRAAIEIMRGCTRGCRFCHAGMVMRPVRERSVVEIVDAIETIVSGTGYEEIGLLSLSSSDYRDVQELVDTIAATFKDKGLSMSLPSLRIESTSADLLDGLGDSRRGGFTFAPEAATESMRTRINKYIPDEQLIQTAAEVFQRNWRTIKLYFMIGHPAETLEDVKAIADLSKAVLAEGRKVHGGKATVNVGVSTFIPKPHTPFQWSPMDTDEQIREKQDLLKKELRGRGLHFRWNDPDETVFEGLMSRGDRRLGAVIESAWRRGAKFDAWRDFYNRDIWDAALDEHNLTFYEYTHRPRDLDEIFPWEHIDAAVKKTFLRQDWLMSQKGETREDCRNQCFACGILPKFSKTRMETPPDAWECPPVIPKHLRGVKQENPA